MNQQTNMAAEAAADLVRQIATKLYGSAGAEVTDLITLANRVLADVGNSVSAGTAGQGDARSLAIEVVNGADFDMPNGYKVEEHLPGVWHFLYGRPDQLMASLTSWNNKAHAVVAAWRDALAARQPVGQETCLLACSTPLREAAYRALSFIDRSNEHGESAYHQLRHALLNDTPTAQAVDLGRQVARYRIEDAPGLDPITVYVENDAPGQGRLLVACYGSAWTAYWGAMGSATTIEAFVAGCNAHYVADNLVWGTDANKRQRACADKVAAAVVGFFKSLRDSNAVKHG